MDVIVLPWTEYERSWGQRPDGVSVHFSLGDMHKYFDEFKVLQEKNYGKEAPHEYSITDLNHAYRATLIKEECDERILIHVLAKTSFRDWKNSPKYLKRVE